MPKTQGIWEWGCPYHCDTGTDNKAYVPQWVWVSSFGTITLQFLPFSSRFNFPIFREIGKRAFSLVCGTSHWSVHDTAILKTEMPWDLGTVLGNPGYGISLENWELIAESITAAGSAYQNPKESQTLGELAQIEGEENAIIMESLIIRERILGINNKFLLLLIRTVSFQHLGRKNFSTYLSLRLHAIKI